MKIRSLAVCAAALFLPFAAAACGDDSTGDLSVGEMSKELQESGLPEDQADCIATDLKEADLTKDDLEEFTESQDATSETGKKLLEIYTKCVTS